jgi:hypothetical protein
MGLRVVYLNIYGIDKSRQWSVQLVNTLCPEAKHEADDGGGGDGDNPRGQMVAAVAVPRLDVQLLVLFVAQLAGSADNVLFSDFHIASIVV